MCSSDFSSMFSIGLRQGILHPCSVNCILTETSLKTFFYLHGLAASYFCHCVTGTAPQLWYFQVGLVLPWLDDQSRVWAAGGSLALPSFPMSWSPTCHGSLLFLCTHCSLFRGWFDFSRGPSAQWECWACHGYLHSCEYRPTTTCIFDLVTQLLWRLCSVSLGLKKI